MAVVSSTDGRDIMATWMISSNGKCVKLPPPIAHNLEFKFGISNYIYIIIVIYIVNNKS